MAECNVCYKTTRVGCARCDTPYCGRECQREDWSQHKLACATVRGSAADEDERDPVLMLERLIESDPVKARLTLLGMHDLSQFIALLSQSDVIFRFCQEFFILRRMFYNLPDENEERFFETFILMRIEKAEIRDYVSEELFGLFLQWVEEEKREDMLVDYVKKHGFSAKTWETFLVAVEVGKLWRWFDVLEKADALRRTFDYGAVLLDLIGKEDEKTALHLLSLPTIAAADINPEVLSEANYSSKLSKLIAVLILYQSYSSEFLQEELGHAIDEGRIENVKVFLKSKKLDVTREMLESAKKYHPNIYFVLQNYQQHRFER